MIRQLFYYSLVLWSLFIFHAPQLWLMYFLHFKHTGSGGLYDAALNAGLVFLWGFIHSIIARDIVKNPLTKWIGKEFYKLFYISVAGITQCLLLYFYRPLSGIVWETHGMLYWVLTFLFLASLSMSGISSLILDYMEVLGVRGILRRMRNQPDPPADLVVRGPYRFTRHPVYLGMIGILWIGPVMTVSRLEFAILGTIYLLVGTFLEDRDTKESLGEAYKEYSNNVPMIIPRLTPWRR